MLIVAFGHEKEVGKDTAATFCITELRLNFPRLRIQKRGFADKLKQQCYELYSWDGIKTADYYEDHRELRDIPLPIVGKTPREIWIEHGMNVRKIYAHTWIDFLLYDAQKHCDLLFIKDLRFPDEGKVVNERGGRVYKIERPSIPHTSDEADDALIGWDGFHSTLLNDGSLNQFYTAVTAAVVPWIKENFK